MKYKCLLNIILKCVKRVKMCNKLIMFIFLYEKVQRLHELIYFSYVLMKCGNKFFKPH